MNKLIFAVVTFLLLSNQISSQELVQQSKVQTSAGEVTIPGKWQQLNKVESSGQIYLKNEDGVIIAIAQNPKKAYPFFKINETDFENVKLFYVWDSDYYKENKFKTMQIKENRDLEYIIWKYNDKKLDNIFLFGSIKNNFINLLVYTNIWSEAEQIVFLENLYKINK